MLGTRLRRRDTSGHRETPGDIILQHRRRSTGAATRTAHDGATHTPHHHDEPRHKLRVRPSAVRVNVGLSGGGPP